VGSGTTLTLTLNVNYKVGFGGNRVAYVAARDQGAGNTNWQALGVWQVPFTAAGSIGVTGVTPPHLAVGAGTNQQVTITLTDSKGSGDFGVINLLINGAIDGRKACYLAYVPSAGTLYLVDDAGDAGGPFAGSMPINGTNVGVQNSQCAVNGSGSIVTTAANTLSLTLNISLTSALSGNRILYAAGRDGAGGNNSGWQAVGTWSVQ